MKAGDSDTSAEPWSSRPKRQSGDEAGATVDSLDGIAPITPKGLTDSARTPGFSPTGSAATRMSNFVLVEVLLTWTRQKAEKEAFWAEFAGRETIARRMRAKRTSGAAPKPGRNKPTQHWLY